MLGFEFFEVVYLACKIAQQRILLPELPEEEPQASAGLKSAQHRQQVLGLQHRLHGRPFDILSDVLDPAERNAAFVVQYCPGFGCLFLLAPCEFYIGGGVGNGRCLLPQAAGRLALKPRDHLSELDNL